MATVTRENGLIYIGDPSFQQTDTPVEIDIDDFGLDQMTLEFGGIPSLLNDFLNRYQQGAAESDLPGFPGGGRNRYPGMFIVGRPSTRVDRSFARVGFKFMGKVGLDPKEPSVSEADSWREDTIQAQTYPPANRTVSVSVTFVFRSLRTTYHYCSKTRPDSPRFANGARSNNLGVKIIRKLGVVQWNGQEFGPLDAALVVQQNLAVFEINQVGKWWDITEAWEWTFVQQRTFFIGATVITI